ncbi:MAG: hypothetical protein HY575_02710, partial [candidate division NC10 bacterium]|nr:hypothetical protein [candidate division NC10 bacterium]
TASYVLRLLKRTAPDMAAYEKERAAWQQSLLAQKEQHILAAWLRDLRSRAEVQIYRDTT